MNNRLTIQDIAALMAERTGKDKSQAELFLKEFVAQVREGVYSDKIAKVKGVGTFKIIAVDQRESIHVNTGERFLIPAHYKFSFLPDKELRDLVNKPFSFFETTELNENVGFSDLDESEEPEDKEADAEDESVEEVMPDELPVEASPVVAPLLSAENASESLEKETADPDENQPARPEEMPARPVPVATPVEEKPAETFPEGELDAAAHETPADAIITSETTPGEKGDADLPPANEGDTFPAAPSDREPIDFPIDDEAQNKKNGIAFRQKVILAFAVLMCCIGIAYLYANRHFIRALLFGVEVVYPDPPASVSEPLPLPEVAASPGASAVDTTRLATAADTAAISSAAEASAPAARTADKTAPKILATVKIEPGSRLTLISLEYYGSKVFWVYLYEYNKARIKDPNNIPVGTRIEVPAPETYGIDVHDKASVRKASALQTEILAGEK